MPVTLEPPLTRGGVDTYRSYHRDEIPLPVGPRYVRSRNSRMWHRPRSGVHFGELIADDGRRMLPEYDSWHMWCGQMRHSHDRRNNVQILVHDDSLPTDGLPVCGTCEGRATGAGHDSLVITHPTTPLLFSPDRLAPPPVCPGSGRRGESFWVRAGDRVGRCLVCDELVPNRAGGGPWQGWYGLTSHEPGPGLVPGCPFHAWRELTITGGEARCRCGR